MDKIIAYDKNGNVYYDYGCRKSNLVGRGSLVSASGNCIIYKNENRIYKAELDCNGWIKSRGILH